MYRHYMRFVDGFWRLIVKALRIVGLRRHAERLMVWNDERWLVDQMDQRF